MIEHTIEVEREEATGTGYAYEFVLYVDGVPVLTATQLEDRGAVGPNRGENWTAQLKRHGLTYCDALDAAEVTNDE